MLIINIFFIACLGLIFGSFTNVLVDRGQKGKKLSGFSKCDFCGYKLKWFDNVPVFSFLLLKGRCRKCHKKLSWQYPLVELSMGLLFLFISWQTGFFEGYLNFEKIIDISFYLIIGFLFLAIFLWDLKYMIIPNSLVLIGVVATFIYYFYQIFIGNCSLFNFNCGLIAGIIGGGIVSLFFYLMFVFSKGRWIGGGDVKLGFWLGLLVGWHMVYLMLLVSYILGALIGVLLLLRKKKKMNSQLPFGPFLIIGTFITLIWGERLLEWYRGLFM